MSHPKPTLPLELVHKIIIYVIAEGVHTICTSDTFSELDDDPEDSDIPDGRDPDVFYWEIHALSTLSAVCWQFKDACMDIAIKTFGAEMPESEDEASLILQVTQKLTTLHFIAHNLKHASVLDKMQTLNSWFLCSYILYISHRHVLHTGLRASIGRLKTGMTQVEKTLPHFRHYLLRLQPSEMGEVLSGAVVEIARVSMCGLQIAEIGENVDHLLGLVEENLSGEQRAGLVNAAERSLRSLESADALYTRTINANIYRGVAEKVLSCDLPLIQPALTRLSTTPLLSDSPEAELRIRTQSLGILARWADAKQTLIEEIEAKKREDKAKNREQLDEMKAWFIECGLAPEGVGEATEEETEEMTS